MDETSLLFVYGALLPGEIDHALVAGAERIGAARTEPEYELHDLGAYAAMVPAGKTAVIGEIYRVNRAMRAVIDEKRQVPILFRRVAIRLDGGSEAEAYVMSREQVRGRRRLHHGDWKKRFAPVTPRMDSPFAKWARDRFRPR